jgi:hypothetical protein
MCRWRVSNRSRDRLARRSRISRSSGLRPTFQPADRRYCCPASLRGEAVDHLSVNSIARRSILLVVPFVLVLLPPAASAQVLRCEIATKYRCDASSGCQKVAASIWNIIDVAKQTIARCDAKGCDTYAAQFAVSGGFVNIALPKNGMLAKMSSDGSSFMETATLTGVALVSFGSCRSQ